MDYIVYKSKQNKKQKKPKKENKQIKKKQTLINHDNDHEAKGETSTSTFMPQARSSRMYR